MSSRKGSDISVPW